MKVLRTVQSCFTFHAITTIILPHTAMILSSNKATPVPCTTSGRLSLTPSLQHLISTSCSVHGTPWLTKSNAHTTSCHLRPDMKLCTGCEFNRELCLRLQSSPIKHSTPNNQLVSMVCYTPISLPVLRVPLARTSFKYHY